MSRETWLITGGAGFIGSHIVNTFLENHIDIVVYDSLHQGRKSRIDHLSVKHNKPIPLVIADIRNEDIFEEVLNSFQPDGIIHTAALKSVHESMNESERYWEVNFHATSRILKMCLEKGIQKFIFSSTAAVYAEPAHLKPIKEDDPKIPISPYGQSKLAAEAEVEKFLAHSGNLGTSLRFFNVIGTACSQLEDNSSENLIPMVNSRLDAGLTPVIFGDDYPTPDGTCIRDFIDVRDIASAHYAAAKSKKKLPGAMNVGTGRGISVREVIGALCEAKGKDGALIEISNRRPGDAAVITADNQLIKSELGFEFVHNPLHSLMESG